MRVSLVALAFLLLLGARGVGAQAPVAPEANGGAPAPATEVAPGTADAAPAPAPAPSSTESARDLFRTGMTAFDERRFHDAISAFRRASEIVPSADLWFNIARAYEELSENEAAIEYYRRYLRDRIDPPDREQVLAHIQQLEELAEAQRLRARSAPTTGTLRVDCDVAGATVRIDGRSVGTSPLALSLTYPAGDHAIDVVKEGYVPFRARVHVDAGSSVVAVATLGRATEYRSVRGRRRFTWVLAALGGASLVAGSVLGVMAVGENRDGNRSDAHRLARYSDYALAGSAVFGVGTVTLYFGEGRSLRTERVE